MKKACLKLADGLGVETSWLTLTDELFENQKIALLGFDLVFAEPDASSGLQQLKQLAESELSTDLPFQSKFKILGPRLILMRNLRKHCK